MSHQCPNSHYSGSVGDFSVKSNSDSDSDNQAPSDSEEVVLAVQNNVVGTAQLKKRKTILFSGCIGK